MGEQRTLLDEVTQAPSCSSSFSCCKAAYVHTTHALENVCFTSALLRWNSPTTQLIHFKFRGLWSTRLGSHPTNSDIPKRHPPVLLAWQLQSYFLSMWTHRF